MKIISACLSNFYLEGMNYQENVLPRVWKRQGHEVMIVTAGFYQDDKNISHIDGNKKCTYKNDDGIEVNILPYASCCVRRLQKVMYTFAGLREILVKFHPDVIFFHGLGSGNIADAVWYKRKIEQNALLILDNHSMKENMAPVMNTKSIKGFAIRSLYRMVNRKYQRYYDAVYNIMNEEKKSELDTVTIKNETLWKYFPHNYTPRQMESIIIKLLDQWQLKKQQAKQKKQEEAR